jgi:hypothetical protein
VTAGGGSEGGQNEGDGARPSAAPRAADALDDAPPFLTWTGIYLAVLGALAAQIALYAALTALYR